MRNPTRIAVFAAGAATLALLADACGSSRKIEEATQPGGSELNFQIQSFSMPAGGTPSVTFRVTDRNGSPVDLLAEMANASAKTVPYVSNGPRFTIVQAGDDGDVNLFESTVSPKSFTLPSGAVAYNQPATQPGSQSAPASNPSSRITAQGNGVFTFAFTAPTTDPSKLSATQPFTVGMWGERVQNRPTGSPKRWPAAATRTFNPDGSPTDAAVLAVSDKACNTCHVTLRAHDRRQTVELCATCHAGSPSNTYRDPESGTNLDLRSMIHRIHNGSDLPSVVAGGKFYIVGFQQSVSDFSAAEFPPLRKATECTTCHNGSPEADAWKTSASFTPCTSCHDEVRFDGSADHPCQLGVTDVQPCEHPLSPEIVNPTVKCSECHSPGASDPAIGPDVVHHNEVRDLAGHWKYEILQVTTGGDRKPVVQFRVSKDGAPNDIKNDAAWKQGASSRLFVDIAWPLAEFTNDGAGYVDTTVKTTDFPNGVPGQGLAVQIDALANATPVAGQANVFQVTSPTAVPPQYADMRVVLEGHPAEGTGTTAIRVPVPNAIQDVAVSGGSPAQRRQIVSAETCNACHGEVSAHGANRNATPAVCVVCHTPKATDFIRVQQAKFRTTNPIKGAAEEPIDFKVLVHEIHGKDIRNNDVTIYGFGGSANKFPAEFPGQTGRCTICHVDGSYGMPFRPEVSDTTLNVGDPTVQGDGAEVRIGRAHAVCMACHDMVHFDGSGGSTLCNTQVPLNTADCNHSGGPQADENSCAGCHGTNGTYDVAKVHAITDQPQ